MTASIITITVSIKIPMTVYFLFYLELKLFFIIAIALQCFIFQNVCSLFGTKPIYQNVLNKPVFVSGHYCLILLQLSVHSCTHDSL